MVRQIDITNGIKPVSTYMIENGKITYPTKRSDPYWLRFEVLKKVQFVGNDLKMDPGIGTCGCQGVLGVGQPTLKIKN